MRRASGEIVFILAMGIGGRVHARLAGGFTLEDRGSEGVPGMKLAFVGLGRMGFPMAGHLAAAGHELTVVDVDATQVAAWLDAHGGEAAATPGEAVDAALRSSSARYLPTPTCRAVGTVETTGSSTTADDGVIWLDHTTASAKVSRELAEHAAKTRRRASSTRLCRAVSMAHGPARLRSWPAARADDVERARPVMESLRCARQPHGAGRRGPTHEDDQPDLRGRPLPGARRGARLRPRRQGSTSRAGRRGDAGRRLCVVGDGASLAADGRGHLRLRFRHGADAQGHWPLPRRGARQRRRSAR